MRIASRDGSVEVFAKDSITFPEKMAFLGNTVPTPRVPTTSFAWISVPTGVLPAVTVCRMITGNSCTPEGTGAEGFCCPSKRAEQKIPNTRNRITIRVNIWAPHCICKSSVALRKLLKGGARCTSEVYLHRNP